MRRKAYTSGYAHPEGTRVQTFRTTRFSPAQLRPLLRASLEPDERIIGWGVAFKKPDGPQHALMMLSALLPGPGTILLASLSTKISRFLILTDRRLLVTLPDPSATSPDRKGVTLDAPIERLSVTELDQSGAFLLRLDTWRAPERLEVRTGDSDASHRLVSGLAVLAQEEADREDEPA